jgi:hypothetical protein
MNTELRLALRQEVKGADELRFERQREAVTCLVRDCSDIGALIEDQETGAIPDSFCLIAPQVGIDRFCTVVRRTRDILGARFSD